MFYVVFLFSIIVENKKLTLNDIKGNPYWEWESYIKCQTCNVAMIYAHKYNKLLRNKISKDNIPKSKINQDNYRNFITLLCDPYHKFGSWITKYDLVNSPPKLLLKYMDAFGECNRECHTISYSCEKNIFSYNYYALIDLLTNESSVKKLQYYFCKIESSCRLDIKIIEQNITSNDVDIGNESFKPITTKERLDIESQAKVLKNSKEFKEFTKKREL